MCVCVCIRERKIRVSGEITFKGERKELGRGTLKNGVFVGNGGRVGPRKMPYSEAAHM